MHAVMLPCYPAVMSQIAGLWCTPATRERVPSIEHPRELRSWRVAHLRGVDSIILFKPAVIMKLPIKGPAVDDLEVLKVLILARRVVGCLPFSLAEEDFHAGRLVRVLPDWELLDPEDQARQSPALPSMSLIGL